MARKHPNPRGFTLIELLVAIGIFSIVVIIVAGAVTSVIDANKKAQTITSVVNNLNFTLESMTRAIKTGDGLEVIDTAGSCDSEVRTTLAAPDGEDPVPVSYRYNGNGTIDYYKDIDGNGSFEADEGGPVTAPEVAVTRLCFFQLGGDQPAVLFTVEGEMQLGTERSRSSFHVQTTVAQRALEIPS
jgi:prepilin-type N-terminal cleavage/methylation domain-containing protein